MTNGIQYLPGQGGERFAVLRQDSFSLSPGITVNAFTRSGRHSVKKRPAHAHGFSWVTTSIFPLMLLRQFRNYPRCPVCTSPSLTTTISPFSQAMKKLPVSSLWHRQWRHSSLRAGIITLITLASFFTRCLLLIGPVEIVYNRIIHKVHIAFLPHRPQASLKISLWSG
jgi:hypothetical protein